VVVSASIGAGHDGAANEIIRLLRDAGYTVDRHDWIDLPPGGIGRLLRSAYALELKVAPQSWGVVLDHLERRPWLARAAGRLCLWVAGRQMRAAIVPGTSLVVSTYPLASQILGRLRRAGRIEAPVITYLTDMSVHALWVHPGVDLHLAVHDVPAEQARALGATAIEQCRPAVNPAFHPGGTQAGRIAVRRKYGLPEHAPIALVVAGSWGVGDIATTTAEIAATGLAIPVVVCGRNDELRESLTRAGTGIPLGWVGDMPELIRACDVVIQNAGGLTSLEAMASGVPVVSYRCLPGHGVTNSECLVRAGLVPWPQDAEELATVLKEAMAEGAPTGLVEALFSGPDAVEMMLRRTPVGSR
jgi:UDP-N-acetylglucosamine:LPS N-acetylglucosamine transferase